MFNCFGFGESRRTSPDRAQSDFPPFRFAQASHGEARSPRARPGRSSRVDEPWYHRDTKTEETYFGRDLLSAGTCNAQKESRVRVPFPFPLPPLFCLPALLPVPPRAFGLGCASRLRGSPLRELLASESMYFAGAATAQQVHHLGSLPGFPPLSRLSCPGPDDAGRSRAVGSKSRCQSVRRSSGSPRSVRASRTFFSVSRRFRSRMRAISASQLQPSPGVTQATTRR